MKKLIISIFTLLIFQLASAQINWVRSYEMAQQLAISQNKFIVMDFWAVWCGPCKTMDAKMWNTEKMAEISDKFIYLKIDVDNERELAMKYSANSIPKVMIIDPAGNKIWEKVGFANGQPYMSAFNEFPDIDLPSVHMAKILEETDDENTSFSLGASYQELGKLSESVTLSRGFYNLSDKYFKQVGKRSENGELAINAEFNLILNAAYRGAHKKAIKKVEKMDEADMKNFILAYCYKCDGQLDKMDEFVKKIRSKELLAQLEK